MTQTLALNLKLRDPSIPAVPLPSAVARKVVTFLNAGNSGNIILNVKEGVVLGARIEEIIKA